MRADPPIGAVTDVPDAIRAGAQIRPLCVTQSSGHAEVLKNVRNGCLTRPEYVSEEEGAGERQMDCDDRLCSPG